MTFARLALRSLSRPRPTFAVSKQTVCRMHRANYSTAPGLSQNDVQTRVLDVLKGFEKIDPLKVCTVISPSLSRSTNFVRLALYVGLFRGGPWP